MPKLIRNTYAGWVSSNPVLALEDTGFERDTGRSKIGDGVTAWNDLNYFNEVSGGGGGTAIVDPNVYLPWDDGVVGPLRRLKGSRPQALLYNSFVTSLNNSTDHQVIHRNFSEVDQSVSVKVGIPSGTATGDWDSLRSILKWKPGVPPQNLLTDHPGTFLFPFLSRTTFYIFRWDGSTYVTLAGPQALATPLNAPKFGWFRSEVVGNVVAAEWWTTDPELGGAPTERFAHTLTGANATEHGSGVSGRAGLSLNIIQPSLQFTDLRIKKL